MFLTAESHRVLPACRQAQRAAEIYILCVALRFLRVALRLKFITLISYEIKNSSLEIL